MADDHCRCLRDRVHRLASSRWTPSSTLAAKMLAVTRIRPERAAPAGMLAVTNSTFCADPLGAGPFWIAALMILFGCAITPWGASKSSTSQVQG
jgi:hypothetical protein